MRYAIDPTKIHKELGWLPETKFEDGIKKTIQWYLDNRDWWENIISGEYQNYYQKMYGKRLADAEETGIMKVFVTGVAGQLGHDVMNELAKRGHEGIGTDLAAEYSGVQDGSAVTKMPYVPLDITDAEAVAEDTAGAAARRGHPLRGVDGGGCWPRMMTNVEKVRAINAQRHRAILPTPARCSDCKMIYHFHGLCL